MCRFFPLLFVRSILRPRQFPLRRHLPREWGVRWWMSGPLFFFFLFGGEFLFVSVALSLWLSRRVSRVGGPSFPLHQNGVDCRPTGDWPFRKTLTPPSSYTLRLWHFAGRQSIRLIFILMCALTMWRNVLFVAQFSVPKKVVSDVMKSGTVDEGTVDTQSIDSHFRNIRECASLIWYAGEKMKSTYFLQKMIMTVPIESRKEQLPIHFFGCWGDWLISPFFFSVVV